MSRGTVIVALIAAAAVLSCQAQQGNGPFTCTSNADCAVEYTNQNGLACNPANQLCWVPPAEELPCGVEFCSVELCNECNGITATFMCNDVWFVGDRNGTCQTVCTPTQAVDVKPTVLLAPYDTDAAVVNLEERELTTLEYEDRRVIYTGLVNKTFEETELQPVKVLVSELVLQEVVEKDFKVTQVAVNTTQITESCEPIDEGSEELACELEEAIVTVTLPYMNITNVTREVLLPVMVEKEYTVPVTVEKTYLIAEERDEFVKMPVLRTRTVELASQGQRTVTLQAPQNSTHSRDITVPMCCACTVDPKDYPITTNAVAAQTADP